MRIPTFHCGQINWHTPQKYATWYNYFTRCILSLLSKCATENRYSKVINTSKMHMEILKTRSSLDNVITVHGCIFLYKKRRQWYKINTETEDVYSILLIKCWWQVYLSCSDIT